VRARDAKPDKQFFLLIDEINRGDIPRIFGELLTVLEKDKRGAPILLPLLEKPFVVPANVLVLGTMNTADRSIALLDAALRRRFAFIELMPDSGALRGVSIEGLPIGPWLDELNKRVLRHAGRDARNLQVGHSYLMGGSAPIQDAERFAHVLRDDIIPLLQEYCYEDYEALERILGATIVQRDSKRINDSLFDAAHRADLFRALLSAFDETITATAAAGETDVTAEQDDDDEDAGDDDDA
jgi:5-methylcytosine-specific restriction protein B